MGKLQDIAARLADGHRPPSPYAPLTGPLAPADLAEAYAAQLEVQRAFSRTRGPIAGRKIALASKAMQEFCRIDQPIAGAIFAEEVHHSPAEIALDRFRNLGLEFELALELSRDAAPGDGPFTAETARGLVASARPAFELIEDRGADYAKIDVLTMVADNAWCGGIVLGPEIPGSQEMDLNALPVKLTQTGAAEAGANTSATRPLDSLAWVLNNAGARGQTIKAGEFVITGSVLTTRFSVRGESFSLEIAGALVTVRIT
jgi:2-keto-4-pentenoate hydratase